MLRADTTGICAEVLLYLDTLDAAGRTPGTLKGYRTALLALGPRPCSLEGLDIRDILDRWSNLNTRAYRLTVIRQFYAFCLSRGFIQSDPSAGIPLPKSRRRNWALVSEDEFQRLCDVATPATRLLSTILYRVGSRIGETVSIRAEHVFLDGDAGTIDFPRRKGGEAGFAAFGIDVSKLLKPWLLDHPGWLFPHPQDGSRPVSTGAARKWLLTAGKVAKIPGRLAPHRLRHSFITQAVDAGWNQLALQKQVGHTDPSSTARYYHPSRRGLMDAYQKARERAIK